MRLGFAVAASLVALAAAPPARAEAELSLRLGIAPAIGSAADDVPMSDFVPLHFPVQLDALWREGPIAAGLYASWGPGRAGRCGPDASCSASVTRLGLQATWTFRGAGGPEPWVGLATGYEWASHERTSGGTVKTSLRGFEPLAAQGGVEWRVHPRLAVGPYGLLGVGRYARMSVDTGLASAAAPIDARAIHAWFHAGVRARLVLGGER
jgi:hypothetical protein